MVEVARRRRGEKFRDGDVYVGRPTRWGNPFKIGDLTRDDSIAKYREWIARHPDLITDLREREPRRLLCWCAPEPCHADVLAELLTTP